MASLTMQINALKTTLARLEAEWATQQALDAPAPAPAAPASPAPVPAAPATRNDWNHWAKQRNIPRGQVFRVYLNHKSEKYLEVVGERDGNRFMLIEARQDGTTERYTAPTSVAGVLKRQMGAPPEIKGGKLTETAAAVPGDLKMLHPSGKYVGIYDARWNGYRWNEETSSYTKAE